MFLYIYIYIYICIEQRSGAQTGKQFYPSGAAETSRKKQSVFIWAYHFLCLLSILLRTSLILQKSIQGRGTYVEEKRSTTVQLTVAPTKTPFFLIIPSIKHIQQKSDIFCNLLAPTPPTTQLPQMQARRHAGQRPPEQTSVPIFWNNLNWPQHE